jgi:glycosyltransferase involved in cell wall biosynthesis
MVKRICIIRQGYFPFDVRVRKEAVALVGKGHQVDVVCLQNTNEEEKECYGGVNVYRLPMKRRRGGISTYLYEYLAFFWFASLKLLSLFLKNRYDIVQVNTLPDFLVFATVIPKLLGAKIILDLHEPAPELWGSIFGFHRKLFIKVVKLVEQLSIRYADHAITVSDEMKENYIRRGASPSKLTVILNVPNPEFDPARYKEIHRNKVNDRFLLVCHSTLVKRYGIHVAIKAMSIVINIIPFAKLTILGIGEYEPELRSLIRDLVLEEQVEFRGFVPIAELIKTIGDADVGIVPVEKNPYSDLVHTNKMFEYIAMRKPVIISRTRAVEDFFGRDDSCLKYFESGDEKDLARCIAELYHHPEQRKKMVRNAYAKFESVRWEKTQEIYCDLFK